MNIDDMITVLQAAKAGKQIQRRDALSSIGWQDMPIYFDGTPICIDTPRFKYRVKPAKPREWCVPEEVLSHYGTGPYVRVREVIE